MNVIPDPASLAADPYHHGSSGPGIPEPIHPAATPSLYEQYTSPTGPAAIIREILTVAAIAGMFWFQIEIVRCFW